MNGFSLHANTDIPAHRRDQLERLIRYTGRGAVSLERLTEEAHGDLVYLFTQPWSDGTTGIKLSPLELLEKLAAIVPLPRAHLVRYAGCLAPHSKLRDAIIPTPRQQGVDGEDTQTGTPYWHWARLLGRVFALDMATCLPPLCGRRKRLRPSLVPPWLAPDHCRHHPGVGDDTHLTSSQAGVRPASHRTCPLSPRAIRVRRGPRQRGPIGDVLAAAVYFTSLCLGIPFEIVPPELSPNVRPAALGPGQPLSTQPSALLICLSRPPYAAPCRAAHRGSKQALAAGDAASAAREGSCRRRAAGGQG